MYIDPSGSGLRVDVQLPHLQVGHGSAVGARPAKHKVDHHLFAQYLGWFLHQTARSCEADGWPERAARRMPQSLVGPEPEACNLP